MPSISTMTKQVLEQTSEVHSLVDRLRTASRRMTGSTGEAPTQLAGRGEGPMSKEDSEPPLLVSLGNAIERLNSATADLRSEVGYLEGFTETARDSTMPMPTVAKGNW